MVKTMTKLVIVCDGMFGLEINEVINQINNENRKASKEPPYEVIGYISDNADPFGEVMTPLPRLGGISDWKPSGDLKCVMGILNPKEKHRIVAILKANGAVFETIVAQWMLAFPFEAGEGCVLAAYSAKGGIRVGNFVTVIGAMLSCHAIGDYSTVLRFANVAGNQIGKEVLIGNHAFLAVGQSIGDNACVEDGSVVVSRVKTGMSVSGIPARRKRKED